MRFFTIIWAIIRAGFEKFILSMHVEKIMKKNMKKNMKKKIVVWISIIMALTVILAGCGQAKESTAGAVDETTVENACDSSETAVSASEEAAFAPTEEEIVKSEEGPEYEEGVTVRVGGLKGPTSIGLLNLKDKANNGQTGQSYEFTMATAADEITTMLVKGELDIALIPANVASVLYNKTEGKISVIDINTLGVLYMVSGDTSVSSPAELVGKTVYLTGKGTTPDYVLQYILKENGLEGQVTLEYKSEATEVAAVLAEDESAIGLLPQPFVTAAITKNNKLQVVMSMTEEWDKIQGESGSRLLTGVTVVNNKFLEEHEQAIKAFLFDHNESVNEVNSNIDRAATLAVEEEIIAAEPVAKMAIPNCNIVCLTGDEMKSALEGYLKVLYEMDTASVGGQLPDENFYYVR